MFMGVLSPRELQGHSKDAARHEGDGVGAIVAEVLMGFGD
jgi:hypothetical protein